MARIGDFGTPKDDAAPVELDTFGWYGVDLRVNPGAGQLVLIDFMEAAAGIDEEDVERGVGLVKGFLRDIVHEDDFDEFWSLARRHGAELQDLMLLMQRIVEHRAAGRPTRPSFDSSAGQQPTEASSRDGSTSRAIARLSGRGDLQLSVVQTQEALAARAG